MKVTTHLFGALGELADSLVLWAEELCDSFFSLLVLVLSISMEMTTHLLRGAGFSLLVLFCVLTFSIWNCVLTHFVHVMNNHMRWFAYWQAKASAPDTKLRLIVIATNLAFIYDSYEIPSGFLSISMKVETHLLMFYRYQLKLRNIFKGRWLQPAVFCMLTFSIWDCVLVRFAHVINRHMRWLAYWQAKASAADIKLRLIAIATNFAFIYD